MNDSNKPPDPNSGSSSDPQPEHLEDSSPKEEPDGERVPTADPSNTEIGESEAKPAPSPEAEAEKPPADGPKAKPDEYGDEGEDEDTEERELGGRMTFLEHLDELRRRIMYSVLSVIIAFGAVWAFREPVYDFIAAPVYSVVERLIVIKPTDPFTIYLKVSFIAAIFVASPFILLQVWLFIAPGLYRKEKGYALPFLLSSTVLFILGGAFAYYVILPPALNFLLLEFGKRFQPMISAIEYFDFTLLIIVGMGVIFQLPVLVAFLSIFGLITPRFLWKNFRYAFLLITIVAAVVSPTTDPFNLFLWSGPMVVLYTISIAISWVFQIRRRKRERELDSDA